LASQHLTSPMRPDDGTSGRDRPRFTIGRPVGRLGPKIATNVSPGGTRKEGNIMFGVAGAMVMAMMGLSDVPAHIEPEHARNPVDVGVLRDGLRANGGTVKLPEPRLRDGLAAEAQRAALREVAGSDARLEELLRNSVTAPHLIKVRDAKAGDDTVRVVDVWF